MYKKILLPIDGSKLSHRAALDGIELACCLGAEAVGLAVNDPFRMIYAYGAEMAVAFPDQKAYEAEATRAAEKHLASIADAAFAAGVPWKQLIVFASPAADAIIAAAKRQKCDVIVMGSHGRGGVGQLLLGSVTNKVLASCHVPVMVHRPGAKRAAARKRAAPRA